MNKVYLLTEKELNQYCRVLLQKCGQPEEDVTILVDTTVKADLRWVSSHGISRLDHYVERMNRGLINPKPSLKIEQGADSFFN